MTQEERSAKYKEQTEDIYRSIGHFAVQFEQIVFAMRFGIRMILSTHGLNNQQLSNILVADLAAMSISKIFKSMIMETSPLCKDEEKIFKAIMKKVNDMIEKRNDVIHSTTFVGWASESDTDFSEASGHKLVKSADGIKVKSFHEKSVYFDDLTLECTNIIELVNRFWGIIEMGGDISKNFSFSNEGDVLPYPPT